MGNNHLRTRSLPLRLTAILSIVAFRSKPLCVAALMEQVLIDSGDLSSAEETERRALDLRRKLSGREHPDVEYALNLLGFVLLAKGESAHARPFLEEALTIRQQELGEKHPLFAGSLANWARIKQSEGDFADARKMLQRALQILEDAGQSHGWTAAQILDDCSLLELDQSNYPQAERYARQALDIRRQL
jgi:tetratricopeptide (TPR) repeat protein